MVQPHGQDHHGKGFFLQFSGFVGIAHRQIAGFRNLVDGVDPRLFKADALLVPGAQEILFIILAKGAHVHVENDRFQVPVDVLLGNHGFLGGVHAADRRTVAVAAAVFVPRPHTLQPGDALGFFTVQRPHDMTEIGAAGRENSFEPFSWSRHWDIFRNPGNPVPRGQIPWCREKESRTPRSASFRAPCRRI